MNALTKISVGNRFRTHGMRRTRIYSIWTVMKSRCQNPKATGYRIYGGRGITVCKRWRKFENFYADMSKGYSDSLSIDRINNDGDYELSNCKWATRKEQANNRRTNTLVTFKGETKNLKEWSVKLGIKYTTLIMRIYNYGWSIDRAFFVKSGIIG